MPVVMAAMAAMAVISKIMDNKAQNEAWAAQEEARRKQRMEMMRQANVADANLLLQDNSNFEAARLELENQTLSHIRAKASVNAAMSESNLEGRSMERISRETDNVYLRTKGMITENYERDYHNIFAQRDSNRNQLIAQLNGDQAAAQPDRFSQVLGTVTAGVQGAMAGADISSTLAKMPSTAKNVEYNKPVKKRTATGVNNSNMAGIRGREFR